MQNMLVAIFGEFPQESFSAVDIASFVPGVGDRDPSGVGGAESGNPFISFGRLLGFSRGSCPLVAVG